MSQEKCEFCNRGELANVKGELICTTCGLVNKSALENKERYISPTFYQKRKLGQERDGKEKKSLLKQINSDIAIIGNYLELSIAIQKQATNNILEILKKEREVYPTFPWNTKTPRWNYNCLLALCIISETRNTAGDYIQKAKIFEYFKNRGGEITMNDINSFIESLTSNYEFIDKDLKL